MLKNYLYRGCQYQFEEGQEPQGAVLVEKASGPKTEQKAKEPKNKARKPSTKEPGHGDTN